MLNSAEITVLHTLAFHTLWNGQPDRAKTLYALLLTCVPHAASVRAGLACAQLDLGHPEEALRALEPLVDDSDPVVHLLLGRAFMKLGDQQSARQAMHRFRQQLPHQRAPIFTELNTGFTQNDKEKYRAR